VATITAGLAHSMVIKVDGAAWGWGDNWFRQLADGTREQRRTPVAVSNLGTVVAIAAGAYHTVALKGDGSAWAWGFNDHGQLGDGTLIVPTTPALVSTVLTGKAVAAGFYYSLFLLDGDILLSTGFNGSGQLGDGTQVRRHVPVPVSALNFEWKVGTPTFSPAAGTYTSAQNVTVSSATALATIRYTTNGADPTEMDATVPANGIVTVGNTMTLRAKAWKSGIPDSNTDGVLYTMNFGTLPAPSISPGASTHLTSVDVTMSGFPGATIRYTTNGADPTAASSVYSAPIAIFQTSTVRARAFHSDYTTSPAAAVTYTIQAEAPTFSPAPGPYPAGTALTLASATPGATIAYTLNGSEPTATGPSISSGGTIIVGNYTLKAKALKTGIVTSATTTGVYTATGSSASAKVISDGQHSHALRADGTAWGWGYNLYGQVGDGTTSSPRLLPRSANGVTGAVNLGAGASHSLLVLSNGTVLSVGYNSNGQLGDGTSTNRSNPVTTSGATTVIDVAAGSGYSVALTSGGAVFAWGAGGYVGDGTETPRLTAVPVSGLSTGVVGISAGNYHTLAVKADGTAWGWGSNGVGNLGDGTTTTRHSPVQVSGSTDVVAVAAGGSHSLALRANGTVMAWGWNQNGQLGDGTIERKTSPIPVPGLDGVTGIAAGETHSLALKADGTVWSWGSNYNGELGHGHTYGRSLATVIPGLANIIQIAAGGSHSMALSSDLTVWMWGRNDYGQVGDGTTEHRLTPVPISGPGMNWKVPTPVLSSAGGAFGTAQSVVITCSDPDASLHYTLNGGDPTTADPAVASGGSVLVEESATLKVAGWKTGAPSSAIASATFVLKVPVPSMTPLTGHYASAQFITLASATPGASIRYTLDGSEPSSASPLYGAPFQVVGSMTVKAKAFKNGWSTSHSAAGSYWIDAGTLTVPEIHPTGSSFTAPPLVRISTSDVGVTIRVTVDGGEPTLRSPEYRFPFELALTTTIKARVFKPGFTPSAVATATFTLEMPNAAEPPALSPAGGTYATQQTVTVTGAAGATLRYTTTGIDPTDIDPIVASGATIVIDRSQVLKVRAFSSPLEPSPVRRADYVVLGSLAASDGHAVALKSNSTVWAWGNNIYGQVGAGAGSPTFILAPQQVLTGAAGISAGWQHTVAVKADGTVWAWGTNTNGQLGIGSFTQQRAPILVPGLTNVIAVAAGHSHSLALKADGTVWSWGANALGELGDGTTSPRSVPVQVIGLSGVTAISAGREFSLAIQGGGAVAGTLWAWGKNDSGQLGEGSTIARSFPVRVLGVNDALAIVAADGWALALRQDGTVWAWGVNTYGQMGTGYATTPVTTPQPLLPLSRVRMIAAGRWHAVVVDADGWLWGWGQDGSHLGGSTVNGPGASGISVPKRLHEVSMPTAVSVGTSFTHIAKLDGTVWGMGANNGAALGTGNTTAAAALVSTSGLTLATNTWLSGDPDQDTLNTWREYLLGLDPLIPDTNGDGITDGVQDETHGNQGNSDLDGDGLSNTHEILNGTDPFNTDTDGDAVSDGFDAFPTDPTRSTAPAPTPGDTTPPLITLTLPTGARIR
jgi:alpha-tubulin suppressor-like RCC1 family protein